MREVVAVIRNIQGIHCRPSAILVKAIGSYAGHVRIIASSGEADGSSIMGLLALGLDRGHRVRLRVEGPDEDHFCQTLKTLFSTKFDFPPH